MLIYRIFLSHSLACLIATALCNSITQITSQNRSFDGNTWRRWLLIYTLKYVYQLNILEAELNWNYLDEFCVLIKWQLSKRNSSLLHFSVEYLNCAYALASASYVQCEGLDPIKRKFKEWKSAIILLKAMRKSEIFSWLCTFGRVYRKISSSWN